MFEAVDIHGNTNTATFTVTVVDLQLPAIAGAVNILATNDVDACGAIVGYTVTASDYCGLASLAQTAGLTNGGRDAVAGDRRPRRHDG